MGNIHILWKKPSFIHDHFTLIIISSSIFLLIINVIILKYYNTNLNLLLSSCLSIQQPYKRLSCLQPYFEKLTYETSPENAVYVAKELQRDHLIDDCHLASHMIGNASYAKFEPDVGRAFAACSIGCVEGCFHGVMESYTEKNIRTGTPLSSISSLCESISDDPLLMRQCIHGVGHGLVKHNPSSVTSAVKKCQSFSNEYLINTCLGGLFMENMNSYLDYEEGALLNKLLSVCESVRMSSNSHLLSECSEAVGGGLMFYTGHNLEKSRTICQMLPLEEQDDCIIAAVGEISTNHRNLRN